METLQFPFDFCKRHTIRMGGMIAVETHSHVIPTYHTYITLTVHASNCTYCILLLDLFACRNIDFCSELFRF